MMYRKNKFLKFYIKNGYIFITNLLYSLKVKYQKGIYDFLVEITEKDFFEKEDFEKYRISEKFFELFLLSYFIVDPKENGGIESLIFEKINYNPSNLHIPLNSQEINKLYDDVEKGIISKLDKSFVEYKKNLSELDFEITKKDFGKLNSTRISEFKSNIGNIEEILAIVQFVFSKRKEERFFNKKRKFFKFGSGGGINSIFPVIFTKNDEIFVYEKFAEKFFRKKINGIFKEFAENCFVQEDIVFKSYDCLVLLFSDHKKVLKKYGNRGHKLIFLEAGEISFMFRLLFGKKNISHVEIQGVFEKQIEKIIQENNIFYEFTPLFIHSLIAKN